MFIYVALGVAFIFHCQKGKAALLLAAYIVHTLKKEGKNIKRSCAMDELAGTAASKGASYLFFFFFLILSLLIRSHLKCCLTCTPCMFALRL